MINFSQFLVAKQGLCDPYTTGGPGRFVWFVKADTLGTMLSCAMVGLRECLLSSLVSQTEVGQLVKAMLYQGHPGF